MEDQNEFKMEDDQKDMEDEINSNGRQPKKFKMENEQIKSIFDPK